MIPLGLGVDLLYIPRIKRLVEEYKDQFLHRVFTREELQYAFKKVKPWEALSSAFAAKEAFYKALGGYPSFKFKEISLNHDPKTGKPFLLLTGKAQELFKARGGKKIELSLSHNFEYTIAIVSLWGEK